MSFDSTVCLSAGILIDIAYTMMPVPVVAHSKAWFCGHSLDGIAGSNLSLVSVVCFQVEVSALG